jgi:hypothetical protein
MEEEVIETPIWSLVLLNREEGLFTVGGTSVASLRKVERDTEDSLFYLEDHGEVKRSEDTSKENLRKPPKKVDSSKEWK